MAEQGMWQRLTGWIQRTPPQTAQPNSGQPVLGQDGRLPPPLSYILKRVLVNTAFYFTWVPYVVMLGCQDADPAFKNSLVFGVAFSGWCFLFQLGMLIFKQKSEPPYILDGALLVFFVIYLAIFLSKEDYRYDMNKYMNVVIHAWLSAVMIASVAVRYPWTRQYAKEAAPMAAWVAPSFRAVCDQLAGIWGGVFGLTCLLSLAPLLTDRHEGKDGLNIFFNYVWPYLMLVLLLIFTRWFPGFMRFKVYLPRMHQSTVKPETGPAGTNSAAGGSGTNTAGSGTTAAGTGPQQPTGAAGQAPAAVQSGGQPAGAAPAGAQPVPAAPARPGIYPPVPGQGPPPQPSPAGLAAPPPGQRLLGQ